MRLTKEQKRILNDYFIFEKSIGSFTDYEIIVLRNVIYKLENYLDFMVKIDKIKYIIMDFLYNIKNWCKLVYE